MSNANYIYQIPTELHECSRHKEVYMALRDYRLCDICGGKAVYDGLDTLRDAEEHYPNTHALFVAHRRCVFGVLQGIEPFRGLGMSTEEMEETARAYALRLLEWVPNE